MKLLVNDIDKDLASCDREIESLKHTLAELNALRGELQKARDDHAALLAPVRKLPVELVLYIFSLLCIDSPSLSITTGTYTSQSITKMPTLNIARTCSQWRRIALSRPELWSNMVVDLGSMRNWDVRRLVDLYLERSRPALLTLRIEATRQYRRFVDYDTDDEEFRQQMLAQESWSLLRVLLDAKPRWERASLYLSLEIYRWIDKRAHDALEEDLPVCMARNLKDLELDWDIESYRYVNGFLSVHFGDASALRTLRIKSPDASLPLPYEQLAELHLMEYDPVGIPKLAARCPQLKYLEVFEPWYSRFHLPAFGSVGQSLALSSSTQPHLPFLRMDYSRPKRHTQDFLNNLRGMLEQSPQIRNLRLEELMFSDSELIEILPLVPSLQNLSETTPVLIPGLTNLMLELQDITWFGEPSLRQRAEIVSMLESRRASLRHFELHATVPDPYRALEDFACGGAHWERLCALKADGLTVTTVSTRTPICGPWLELDSDSDSEQAH
ncbi:hypothetical protein D9758_013129 [Tetrapyrgos nigripes]|uniref:F-box domain-containing protein n=1 Tax=Tetrapyrgos nigripes TaxID=182062 RepID=A0A8H5FI08_9AGAR|nr:hypothetical protein D9758_013129 [Tetrapyrgos nigripes]